jgi:hypothetical protein
VHVLQKPCLHSICTHPCSLHVWHIAPSSLVCKNVLYFMICSTFVLCTHAGGGGGGACNVVFTCCDVRQQARLYHQPDCCSKMRAVPLGPCTCLIWVRSTPALVSASFSSAALASSPTCYEHHQKGYIFLEHLFRTLANGGLIYWFDIPPVCG